MAQTKGEPYGFDLVRLADRHLAKRAEFTSDPELRRLFGIADAAPDTLAGEREWLACRQAAGDLLLAIEVGGQYVGDMDVFFDPANRAVQFTLMIGDVGCRGRGIGTETVRRVLRWLFSGGKESLGPGTGELPGERRGEGVPPPAFAPAYAEVDTEPGRNPLAHEFWLKQGFRFHHFEGELRWLRLTRHEYYSMGLRNQMSVLSLL